MRIATFLCLTVLTVGWSAQVAGIEKSPYADLPSNLRVVLDNTQPLPFPRQGRLPLLVLPISNALAELADSRAAQVLRDLDRRGIGYTVDWQPEDFQTSLAEGLRIGALQQQLGLQVAVNANACLYSFFDGSAETLHVDDDGNVFAETSFGGRLGCPFAIEHRYPVMKERVEKFLREYKMAGIDIDFVFADWEVDGPIEWNDAWLSSKRCRRCRLHVSDIEDFRQFQKILRQKRCAMQRVALGDNVTSYFPAALVGNYAVYPHDGYRYWYDYFEHEAEGVPLRMDQRARYREWYHEFPETGYTFAMPVVYTWYRTFGWYDYEDLDFRWFYNMLMVASNAGRHTPHTTPIVPFVHWTTTAPPKSPDRNVQQFSEEKYRELLWHLLLRGHDTFFLWCVPDELAQEIRLVHDVYARALEYRGFLDRGIPVTFDVPQQAGPVVSGLRLGNHVLVRRTEFGGSRAEDVTLQLSARERLVVPPGAGMRVLEVQSGSDQLGFVGKVGSQTVARLSESRIHDSESRATVVFRQSPGFLKADGKLRFPLGFYELPASDEELRAMAASGVNLVRCGNRTDLDRAHAAGLLGWVPLNLQQGATDALRQHVKSVLNHPALAVWEGPDEIVWTFTAYSQLERTAGFTRDDWNRQSPRAVEYAKEQGEKILPKLREGIELVRELDERQLPFWINEAADSDMKFVREYVDAIDITGCDYYAVRSTGTDLQSIGRLVDRWQAIGRGKPVWMVLQAFSWHTIKPERSRLYPSFDQSRFMAYDAIAHGARGLLYWGSNQIDDPAFRRSLYALTAEVAELEPFLVGQRHEEVQAQVVNDLFDPPGRGVRTALFSHGPDYLLILVNEDAHRHLGVDVAGLDTLNGRRFELLYGQENVEVKKGGFVTRLQGHEVKVFSTNAMYASRRREGRDYRHSDRN